MLKHFSDVEIIECIENQSDSLDSALKYLYKANYDSIKALILKNSGHESDVPDLYQESIIVVYNSIANGNFKKSSSISTYLYSVARNTWYKQLRSQKNRTAVTVDELEGLPEVIDRGFDEEINSSLHRAMEQLAVDCKTLLIDFYFNKLSMKGIMDKFKLGSVQAAKTKKFRCMSNLITICQQMGLTKEIY